MVDGFEAVAGVDPYRYGGVAFAVGAVGDEGAVLVAGQGPSAFVEAAVVEGADEGEVVDVGGAVVGPVRQVVGVEVTAAVTAGEPARSIPDLEGVTQPGGDHATAPAEVQRVSAGPEDEGADDPVAGQAAGDLGSEPDPAAGLARAPVRAVG